MKNFIFISPNFPTNYWQFCKELKNNGLNVLGIGDQPYDDLSNDLKESLNEYYKVDSLENYDEVYRAVAFFIHKYGPIDWLESNNEYWLERDAKLRTAYHITSGFQEEDIPRIKFKSKMKEFYIKAGIPVARYHLVDTIENCKKFIKKVGYPVITKPDNGVGAADTYKISNDSELASFFEIKQENVQYIMEEFINAEINSYDAIIDADGNPMFETGNVTPMSVMDIVNNADNSIYYIVNKLPADTRKAGRATVKSFGVKSRFIHFEFFRLLEDHEGMGKKGDIVALEVNMRPCGGFTPDMINFAHSTNVYKIWADMIAFNKSTLPVGNHSYCAFAGLRDGKKFVMTHEDIMNKYGEHMKMVDRIPDVFSGAMGNQMYVATFATKREMNSFYNNVLKCEE
ncbi:MULTISPECIES: ATP-grasp domain-containing protein [Anaerostipes]|uniref:ATP-grasp domain-containing protein n=1 Tax=Anaerostipes TaxID=207244 RepID=UPI00095177BC|nr:MULTISPECIES: ATP-grasp domain-containing protein [Anaerostipes]OLR58500.1 carbamoylphosphate synthase large subunit [Anaerostipes sp. 494a]